MRRAERFLDLKQAEVRAEIERSAQRVLRAVDVSDDLAGYVRRRPVVSLGVAVAAGFTVGAVAGRGGGVLFKWAGIVMPYVTPVISRVAPQVAAFVRGIESATGSFGR